MKYACLLLSTLFLMSFTFIGNPDLIIGKWQMEKVEKSPNNIYAAGNKFLDFKKGGTVISSKKDSDVSLTGKWHYDEAKKQIIIENKGKKEIAELVSISEKEMVVIMGEGKLYLKKVE